MTASQPILYGAPQSSFVRTARIALLEKTVDYDLIPVRPSLETQPDGARHPFGKIPFFRHGDLILTETVAITRYIDRVFDGPALQPKLAVSAARCDMWISAVSDYLYTSAVRGILLPRIVFPALGMPVDEAAIAAITPMVEQHCQTIDRALADRPYLADETPCLADYFLLPIAAYLDQTPEGKKIMAECMHLSDWLVRMAQRPSVITTEPPPFTELQAAAA